VRFEPGHRYVRLASGRWHLYLGRLRTGEGSWYGVFMDPPMPADTPCREWWNVWFRGFDSSGSAAGEWGPAGRPALKTEVDEGRHLFRVRSGLFHLQVLPLDVPD
jgi:hypothetical protein